MIPQRAICYFRLWVIVLTWENTSQNCPKIRVGRGRKKNKQVLLKIGKYDGLADNRYLTKDDLSVDQTAKNV